MIFTFKHNLVSDTYFKDLDITVSSADKFDFYENGELTGTLIDSFDIGIGLFRDSTTYYTKKKRYWESRYSFSMGDDSGTVFALADVKNGKSNSSVLFHATNISYRLHHSKNKHPQTKYRDHAEFHIESDVYCMVDYYPYIESPNWWKRNFTPAPFEGIIELAEGLSREYILAFMLVLSRQISINEE